MLVGVPATLVGAAVGTTAGITGGTLVGTRVTPAGTTVGILVAVGGSRLATFQYGTRMVKGPTSSRSFC